MKNKNIITKITGNNEENKKTKCKIKSIKLETKSLIIFLIIIFVSSMIKISSYKIRPVHHDEAVYNYFSKKILNKTYTYDPEYHGPLMFIIQGFSLKILGDNINGLRFSYLLFSFLTLLLLLTIKNNYCAEKFLALTILISFSPILNFYSSYACWESGFLFFYILFIISLIKIIHGKTNFIYLFATSSALMMATYESGIIIIIATILLLLIFFYNNIKNILKNKKEKNKLIIKLLLSLLIFILTISLFFSLFFMQNPISNISKMIKYNLKKTYTTGHNKPFYYYATKILPLEIPAVMLFIYSFIILVKILFKNKKNEKNKNFRDIEFKEQMVLLLLTIIVFIILSIMPYKVPWLSLLYLPPLIFFSTTAFEINKKLRDLVKPLLIFITLYLSITTIRLNFYDYDNIKNPLAYVQSTRELPKTIEKILSKNPERGLIISKEYWPLPWYFRNLSVDYYSEKPNYYLEIDNYDFIILDEKAFNKIKNNNLTHNFNLEKFEIRPYVYLYLFLKE